VFRISVAGTVYSYTNPSAAFKNSDLEIFLSLTTLHIEPLRESARPTTMTVTEFAIMHTLPDGNGKVPSKKGTAGQSQVCKTGLREQ
jgi:hypothetical protein